MRDQRPSGPGGDAAALRETEVACEDECENLRREVCRLRALCARLESRLSFLGAALELAYRAGERDTLARLGLAPRQERQAAPRRYLSIAPGVVIAAGGIAALVTAAGIGAG